MTTTRTHSGIHCLVALSISLLGCLPSSSSEDDLHSELTVTYAEDFNDGLAQSWSLPGGISVSGGNLHTDSWSIDPFATYDGATFSGSYTYKLDVKTIAGGDGNRIKIVFNAADSANYYALDLGGGAAPNIYLRRVIGGVQSTIATSTAHTSILDASVYTTIEITYASGGVISAKATKGGTTTTLFANVQDTSRTAGKIGVTVHACMAQFDNVSISTAPTNAYSEDFNDNQAQNWTLPSGISVSNSYLHTDSWSIDPFALYNGMTFSAPFTYRIDVKTIAGGDGNRVKIVFNAADSANYYFLDLGGGAAPNIYLRKVIGGVQSTIATSAAHTSIVDASVYTTIEISYASGGLITAKAIKGGTTTTLFNSVADTSRTSGKIGVAVHACMAQFDNVSVSGSGGTTEPPTFDVRTFLANYGPQQAHEGRPSGVPTSWDWYSASTPAYLTAPAGTGYLNWWSVAAVDLTEIRPSNTRVEFRRGRLLVLPQGSNTWVTYFATATIDGGGFKADFTGPCTYGGVSLGSDSISLDPLARCFDHFWPANPAFQQVGNSVRAAITIGAVRLILANPNGTDDRANSHFLIQMGGDWRSPDGSCPMNSSGELVCAGIEGGRFIYPKVYWRAAVMSTLSAQDLATLPMPPVEAFRLPDGTLPTE